MRNLQVRCGTNDIYTGDGDFVGTILLDTPAGNYAEEMVSRWNESEEAEDREGITEDEEAILLYCEKESISDEVELENLITEGEEAKGQLRDLQADIPALCQELTKIQVNFLLGEDVYEAIGDVLRQWDVKTTQHAV